MIQACFPFDGGAVNGILSLDASSPKPCTVAKLNSHSTYVIGRDTRTALCQ
jgi:hypothetical protein